MNRLHRFFITISLLPAMTLFIHCSDGSLDTQTYNPSALNSPAGTKLINFDSALIPAAEVDTAFGVTTQTVGGTIKIVTTGSTTPIPTNVAIARQNYDGSPDASFNNPTGPSFSDKTGTIYTAVPNTLGLAAASTGHAVVSQPDGKLVVAGIVTKNGSSTAFDIAVLRYNVDGSLDTSFNNPTGPSVSPADGIIITPLGTTAQAFSCALQADGKIVVAGGATISGDTVFFAARFNTDGSLDSAEFNPTGTGSGVPGITVVAFTGFAAASVARSVAIQPDQQIVLAGFAASSVGANPLLNPLVSSFAAARLNPDGSLDTATFNSGGGQPGTNTTAFGSGLADVANGVAFDTDGNIILAGFTTTATVPTTITEIAVLRYTPDGVLDTSFNGTGTQTTGIGTSSTATGVVVQPWDNNIIATGSTLSVLTSNDFALVRYVATNGQLDSSFGTGGIVTTDIAGLADLSFGSTLQSDRKVVLAGSAALLLATVDPVYFATARYNVNAAATLFVTIIDPEDGSTTTNATPPITVTTLPGATVTISIDGEEICTTTANSSGFATCFPPAPLAPGLHTATATATLDGESADATPVNFTVVGTVFVQEIFPAPNSTINTTTPTIYGITNPGNSVTLTIDGVQINGTVIADSEGNFFFTVTTPLSVGDHTKVVTATNSSGTAVETSVFTIDPSICITPSDELTNAIRQKYNS